MTGCRIPVAGGLDCWSHRLNELSNSSAGASNKLRRLSTVGTCHDFALIRSSHYACNSLGGEARAQVWGAAEVQCSAATEFIHAH